MDDWLQYLLYLLAALVAALYGHQQYELRRLARNIHSLRNKLQAVIMTLAAQGIVVRNHDDDT